MTTRDEFIAIRLCSVVLLWICLVLAATVSFRIFYRTPWFEDLFRTFGTALPTMTVVALNPWFEAVVPCLAVIALLKELLPNKATTLLMNGLILGLILIVDEIHNQAMLEAMFRVIK